MKKWIITGAVLMAGFSVHAEVFGRFAGGSWHNTENTWRIGSAYTGKLPGSGDAVRLVSKNETIEMNEEPVVLGSLVVGSWDEALQKQVTLIVRSDLTTDALSVGYLNGAPAQQWGNGELVVSGAAVKTGGNTCIGGMGSGALTVSDGGKFENNKWRINLGPNGKITIDDGIVSMTNGLIMEDGASVYINGKSELHIVGNNQTSAGAPLMKYIKNGWIYGNGTAGNVQAVYDGEKTRVSVPADR